MTTDKDLLTKNLPDYSKLDYQLKRQYHVLKETKTGEVFISIYDPETDKGKWILLDEYFKQTKQEIADQYERMKDQSENMTRILQQQPQEEEK